MESGKRPNAFLYMGCVMTTQLFILGAADPEMEQIERLVTTKADCHVAYLAVDGKRVSPYQAAAPSPGGERGTDFLLSPQKGAVLGHSEYCIIDGVPVFDCTTIWVECTPPVGLTGNVVLIDHHRPGDAGHGHPIEKSIASSSLGQVAAYLGVILDERQRYVAACDHNLGAAYQGLIPDIDPTDVVFHRAATAVEYGTVYATVEEWHEDFRSTSERLFAVDKVDGFRTLQQTMPLLPDVASFLSEAYEVPIVEPGGRKKIVIGGHTTPDMVSDWLARCDGRGLVGFYGSPERGFAGAYVPLPERL
jgi:hypothetical protein